MILTMKNQLFLLQMHHKGITENIDVKANRILIIYFDNDVSLVAKTLNNKNQVGCNPVAYCIVWCIN